jgi:hypothetical protein
MKIKSDIRAGSSIGVVQANVATTIQFALASNGGVGVAIALNVAITDQVNIAVPTSVSVSVG